MPDVPDHVAVLGLGLMGGSICAALRKRGGGGRITGYARRPETLTRAGEAGWIDEGFDDPSMVVEGADLVVLCVPILAMKSLLEAALPGLKHGAVVTDVGSTKHFLVQELSNVLRGGHAHFVGSHPIAGSDQQGLEAANPDLYEGSVVVVTPAAPPRDRALDRVRAFWAYLGSRVVVMEPHVHDQILARTSHLPHLAAAALSLTVAEPPTGDHGLFCGRGFEDSTRIASGSADVWIDIFRTNRDEILEALPLLERQYAEIRSLLEQEDWDRIHAWLNRAGAGRAGLLAARLNGESGAS